MKQFPIFLAAISMAACASEPAAGTPTAPRPPSEAVRQASEQRPRLVPRSESDLAEFVEARGSGEVEHLSLSLGNYGDRLRPLARLKRLDVLELSYAGIHNHPPPTMTKEGRFEFAAQLTDDQARDITEIRSLQRLDLWYASLTEAQRALLRDRLPRCKVRENLNKL